MMCQELAKKSRHGLRFYQWAAPPDSEVTEVISGEGTFTVRAEMQKGRQPSEDLGQNTSTEGKKRQGQRGPCELQSQGIGQGWNIECPPKPHTVEPLSPTCHY